MSAFNFPSPEYKTTKLHPRSGSRASPCTPASGGQPLRTYVFYHRTSFLSVFPSHEILEKTRKLIWGKNKIFFCFSQFSHVPRAKWVSDGCACASPILQLNNDQTIHRKGAKNAKKNKCKMRITKLIICYSHFTLPVRSGHGINPVSEIITVQPPPPFSPSVRGTGGGNVFPRLLWEGLGEGAELFQ